MLEFDDPGLRVPEFLPDLEVLEIQSGRVETSSAILPICRR